MEISESLLNIVIKDMKDDIAKIQADEAMILKNQELMGKDIASLKAEYDEVLKTEKEIKTWLVRIVKYFGPAITAILAIGQLLMLFGVHL